MLDAEPFHILVDDTARQYHHDAPQVTRGLPALLPTLAAQYRYSGYRLREAQRSRPAPFTFVTGSSTCIWPNVDKLQLPEARCAHRIIAAGSWRLFSLLPPVRLSSH